MNTKTFNNKLRELQTPNIYSIKYGVIKEALSYDEPMNFLNDLLNFSCVSGMVNSMIYYTDTHTFYEEHYEEIEDLREEYEMMYGKPLKIEGDLKNHLSWFAYQQTARKILDEIGLEM